ncbi:uncharacterized protein EI90DRAFT_1005922 [Cantharellus anzutake]|uniref:uncharacterized protein n=1 Tax=Cantharellus anzutake TaxID=1750568 RepID=UPI001905382A|nr:uncharacterized protein EI90DRAFT_1005922 [Cantharellus anzutake]KAF8331309.1 hypothetical protein EI90DRAFT_1005922 [Cantharellus anzutake]
MNISLHPITSDSMAMDLQQAWGLSNSAVQASRSGDHAAAERLHRETLKLKQKNAPGDAIGIALSKNGLGEALYDQGKYNEAYEVLKESLAIREVAQGQEFDAAVTRENLAQTLQSMGKVQEARDVRVRGIALGQLCCSNYKCPGQLFARNQLKHCGGCGLPHYCSVNCQKVDWKARHKGQCKMLQEVWKKENKA